jgi:hypothetical protein
MKIITFKSYNQSSLLFTKNYLISLLETHQVSYSFYSKPLITKKISLLKSPHVYKKFKEHYVQTEYVLNLQVEITSKQFARFLPLLNLNRNSISFEIKG